MKKSKKPLVKTQAVERRSTLDQHKKEAMLAVLIRNRDAHEAVAPILKPLYVEAGIGNGQALVWAVVKQFYETHEELPGKDFIIPELHNTLKADPDLLSEDELEETDEFIDYVFNDAEHGKKMPTSKLHAKTAIEACRLFLEEQLAMDASEKVVKGGTVPTDLLGFLVGAQQQVELVQGLTSTKVDALYSENWDKEDPLVMHKTRFAPFETFFGGGMVGGEVYVFMGPYGSCKTTIAVQITMNFVETASIGYASGKCPPGKIPVAILVSTEMDKREARRRIMSYSAQIPRETLQKMKTLEDLSKATKPAACPATAYEKELFDSKKTFMNEYDRARCLEKKANMHLLFIDCSGTDNKYRNAGAGGMTEVAAIIAAELRRRRDLFPVFICLDHASALANRMIESGEHTNDEMRHLLRNIPRIGGRIAKKYNVPMLIMHQLNGEANGRSPIANQHHTDAAECKSFAEYADFAVVTGPPTEDERQIARFLCTKHRREPPRSHAFVKIDGSLSRVIDVSVEYTVDNSGRIIVRKDELNKFNSVKVKAAADANDDNLMNQIGGWNG